jgi:hypothetical protein
MVAVVSAVIAVLGAIFTAVSGYWWQSRLRSAEHLNYLSHYRDSLLWSAFDLQSRLWNILYGWEVNRSGSGRGFIRAFLLEGSEPEAVYARRSTAYLFAEYLGWAEIFRRDIKFLDLGRGDRNWQVMMILSQISRIIGSSNNTGGRSFRVFRVDQRAIGELMIAPESKPGERWCIGYAEFCRRSTQDSEFGGWIEELLGDLDLAAREPEMASERLAELQNQLISLIDLLDPRAIRFPAAERSRFTKGEIARRLADNR